MSSKTTNKHEIEFFAFLHVDANDAVIYDTDVGAEEQENYLNYVKNHALQFREMLFSAEDRYVVLFTCTTSSTNGRHILIGRVKEQS